MTNMFKATNPRDKVFALLGISRDGRKLPFKPDYDVDEEQVFLKTAAFVLSSEEWFFTFASTGIGYESYPYPTPSKTTVKLPSWVFDPTSDRRTGQATARIASIFSRDLAEKVTFTSDDRIIQLQVFPFDSIHRIDPKCWSSIHIARLLDSNSPKETFTANLEHAKTTFGAESPGNWYFSSRKLAWEALASPSKSTEIIDQDFWQLCMSQHENVEKMSRKSVKHPHSIRRFRLKLASSLKNVLSRVGTRGGRKSVRVTGLILSFG